ncbi:MAG: C10 family peptidase [Paramuribaculum sp.]|nr:C10 family peptidase [Paramuribaculum sp.]
MKKIITLVAMFTMTCWSYAAQLSPEQALKRVTKSSKVVKSLGSVPSSPKLMYTGEITGGMAAYYIFSDESGAMFVSADDVAQPLLGYTDSGEFDLKNMPPQLQGLLEQYASEIEWAMHNDSVIAMPESSNTVYATQAKAAISTRLTTKWNQRAPFYNLCPTKNGQRTLTGCVATSTAQVMNYFEWPQSAAPAITHTWNGQTLTAPSVTFDWKNMLDSYNGSYNTTQANAVAQLMRSVGYAVKMDYGVDASGAYHSNVRTALIDKFGYDPAISYLRRSDYTTEVWEQLLYDNIKSIGPVIYDGNDNSSGHSFVLDGYNGNGAFHINWGWGGSYDGYFVLTALNPGNNGPFNLNQTAILGIRRPRSSSDISNLYIGCDKPLTGKVSDRTITFDNGFWNKGCAAATFDIGFMFENVVTGAKRYETSLYSKNFDVYEGCYSYSTYISYGLVDGVYRVYPVYKVNSGEWELTKLIDGTPQYLLISKSSDKISVVNEDDIAFSSCRVPSDYQVGSEAEGYISLINASSAAKTVTVGAYLTKEKDSKEVCHNFGTVTGTIPSMSEKELKVSGTVPELDAGTYYLIFTHNGNQVAQTAVKVYNKGIVVVNDVTVIPDEITPGRMSYVTIGATSSFLTNQTVNFGVKLVPAKNPQSVSPFVYGTKRIVMKPDEYSVFTVNNTIPAELETGVYDLVVYDADSGIIFDTMTVEVTLDLLANITVNDVTVIPDVIVQGAMSYVTVGATSKFIINRTIDFGLKLSPEKETAMTYPFTYGTISLLMKPNEYEVFTFSNTIPDDLVPGRYNLILFGVDNGEVLKTMSVEVYPALSAVDSIGQDSSDEVVRLFNLQGVEVKSDQITPGIYIRKSSGKVEKILVK